MKMAHEPDDCDPERDYQKEKNDSSFAAFFAERFSPATRPAFIAPAFVLERDGNIEPAPAFARPCQKLFPLPPRRLFRHPGRFRDHSLELFHLPAQLRFALGQFFLFLVKRRPGLRSWSAAHAGLLNLLRHPKEYEQREDPKSDQRQGHCEPDLKPLHE